MENVLVYKGEQLARYGFGQGHPFGPDRHDAFFDELRQQGLDQQVIMTAPVVASQSEIESFHTHDYVEKVKCLSESGEGYLDCGDTPAVPGIYQAASAVVGTTLDAVDKIMRGETGKAFIPIAGLHHARRDSAAGFCVFNDCGIAIEMLRQKYDITRVAYVDIDAHHGDGVFYSFETDPNLCFVDFHEDGRYLYPGTGAVEETGKGPATGTKLNIPVSPDADDDLFRQLWPKAEQFIANTRPEFILFQCGADSLNGDPITHLRYSEATHAFVTERLCAIADQFSQGRLLAMGGGGYNRQNLAMAWCAVVGAMLHGTREHSPVPDKA